MTAGVEVQATILDNLRHRLFVMPVPRPVMAAARARGGAACAALCAAAHVVADRAARGASSGRAAVVGSWVLLRYGRVWAPPALPAAAALGVFGARFGLDYARERQLRRRCRRRSRATSRRTSSRSSPATRPPSSSAANGATCRSCSATCAASRRLSERLKDEPERLTTLINRLLDPCPEAVLAEGGTIDKYMGDCVMAFWNAPLPSPDHPLRAVRAALADDRSGRAASTTSCARERGRGAPVFAVGVGINTGDCVVGNVGSRWRYDYSGARRHGEPRLAAGGPVEGIRRLDHPRARHGRRRSASISC